MISSVNSSTAEMAAIAQLQKLQGATQRSISNLAANGDSYSVVASEMSELNSIDVQTAATIKALKIAQEQAGQVLNLLA